MSLKYLFIIALASLSQLAFSQETKPEEGEEQEKQKRFVYGGVGNLGFSHAGYGQYYSGGGLGTVNVDALIDLYSSTNTSEENKSVWDNNLRIDYGMVRIDNTNGERFTKSSDNLDYITKYGTPMGESEHWFYSTALTFQTQLTDTRTAFDEDINGFTQLIGSRGGEFGTIQSTILAPADLSLGIGLEYKPSDKLSIFSGPVSGKIRMVLDDRIAQSGLMGNEVIYNEEDQIIDYEKTRIEAGANIITNYHDKFWENDKLSFKTNLKLFSNYLDKPENIDVNWNTLTSLNPWKFITINYTTNLAYDDNKTFTAYANGEEIIDGPARGVQFKNVLGVGMQYRLNGDFKKKKISTDRLIYNVEHTSYTDKTS